MRDLLKDILSDSALAGILIVALVVVGLIVVLAPTQDELTRDCQTVFGDDWTYAGPLHGNRYLCHNTERDLKLLP